jgi:hypothetical protein
MLILVNMIPQSLSGESHQDSEPFLSVNPANCLQLAATAFTPDPMGGPNAPIYVSVDGGLNWMLNCIVPNGNQYTGTNDITLCFNTSFNSPNLYAAALYLLSPTTSQANALRTNNILSPNTMELLDSWKETDQPYIQSATVLSGTSKGSDRIYIGNNKQSVSKSANVNFSLNAAQPHPAPLKVSIIEKRDTGDLKDGPSIRPVIHSDGTVYAAFYGWRKHDIDKKVFIADLVVVRDDKWGSGSTPFTALIDPDDNLPGLRVVKGVQIPAIRKDLPVPELGQQRLTGFLSIAVHPIYSDIVYLVWSDLQQGIYTLHVSRSQDRGKTWSNDLKTIKQAVNPALAINTFGELGLLYQKFIKSGGKAVWKTYFHQTLDGSTWTDVILSTTPAETPAKQTDPYLGDYVNLLAVNDDFYGVFCANNTPDANNFAKQLIYRRNADFGNHALFAADGITQVESSIDPFFFKASSQLIHTTPAPLYGVAAQRLDVFWQAKDGSLMDSWWDGHQWSSAPIDPGPLDTAPAPIYVPSPLGNVGSIYVFWKHRNGNFAITSASFSDGQFVQTWKTDYMHLPAVDEINSPLAPLFLLAPPMTPQVQIFFRGPDSSISFYAKDLISGFWHYGKVSMPDETIASAPAPIYNTASRKIHLFWKSVDGSLVDTSWTPGGPVSEGSIVPGPLTSIPVPLYGAFASGRIDVFWRAADGSLMVTWWDGHQWQSKPGPRSNIMFSSPAPLYNQFDPHIIKVYWRTQEGHLNESWWDGQQWVHTTLDIGQGFLCSMPAPFSSFSTRERRDIFWRAADGSLMDTRYAGIKGWTTTKIAS